MTSYNNLSNWSLCMIIASREPEIINGVGCLAASKGDMLVEVLFDKEDFHLIERCQTSTGKNVKWHVESRTGSVVAFNRRYGYRYKYTLHLEILQLKYHRRYAVIHRNMNKCDNRKKNLAVWDTKLKKEVPVDVVRQRLMANEFSKHRKNRSILNENIQCQSI